MIEIQQIRRVMARQGGREMQAQAVQRVRYVRGAQRGKKMQNIQAR